jgi:hypothetical protein
MCQKCDLVMVLLGKLPGVALRVAVRVIRCYVCNNVISEEWKSASVGGLFHIKPSLRCRLLAQS